MIVLIPDRCVANSLLTVGYKVTDNGSDMPHRPHVKSISNVLKNIQGFLITLLGLVDKDRLFQAMEG